jgi:hypothetical protein
VCNSSGRPCDYTAQGGDGEIVGDGIGVDAAHHLQTEQQPTAGPASAISVHRS